MSKYKNLQEFLVLLVILINCSRGRDRMKVADQCLSPLKLWVRTPFIARCTRYNIMW